MKAKFGAIVTDGRGKLGGHFFSKNKGGPFIGSKVSNSAKITKKYGRRNRFIITTSRAWRNLTDAQRSSWNAAVSDFSKTDIFGDLRNPSGFNLFSSINFVRLENNYVMLTLPPQPGCSYNIDFASLVITRDIDLVEFNWTPALPAGYHVYLWISYGQSPGRGFDIKKLLFFIARNTLGEVSYNGTTRYNNYISGLPPVGSKVYGMVQAISDFNGVRGNKIVVSTIVKSGV